jgi:thiosulfate/3-mercaptopyruvate sulfurtransferase
MLAVIASAVTAAGNAAQAADFGSIEAQALNRTRTAWVILDARPKSEWLAGHLPGARSFSWENYTRTDARGVQYKVLPQQELARALGEMGIDEQTPVAIYGDADKSWGGEGWDLWTLGWLGHKAPVRLLSGGIQAWRGQHFPLNSGAETALPHPKRYAPLPQAQLDISTAELARLGSTVTIIDTRATMEWLMGRIPGAVHIAWEKFYSGKERRPIDAAALKKLLQEHGVPLNKPIVYYCLGGIRSGYAWMVHTLDGLPAARNYEGGYEEWKKLAAK